MIHPGSLSGLCWKRLAKHLPAGTSLRVLELEAINAYWEQETSLTVDALADRLKLTLDPRVERVLCGWGVGGVVAAALATRLPHNPPAQRRHPRRPRARHAPPRRARPAALATRCSSAPAAAAPLNLDPNWRAGGLEPALENLREAASRAGGLRDGATTDVLRRGYHQHARDRLRDFRLIRTYEPAGVPVTVVKAARSLLPDSARARVGEVRPGRAAGERRRPLHDAHRAGPGGAPRFDAAAVARVACDACRCLARSENGVTRPSPGCQIRVLRRWSSSDLVGGFAHPGPGLVMGGSGAGAPGVPSSRRATPDRDVPARAGSARFGDDLVAGAGGSLASSRAGPRACGNERCALAGGSSLRDPRRERQRATRGGTASHLQPPYGTAQVRTPPRTRRPT